MSAARPSSPAAAGGIGAFFDLDGTLLPRPSLERRFRRYLRWRGELTLSRQLRWVGRFLFRCGRNWLAATEGNKAYLAGVPYSALEAYLHWLDRRPPEFFPQALERLRWHAAQGHRIFLVTGTLQPLADWAARQLPVRVTSCASGLEVVNQEFTGRARGTLCGDALCGPAKAKIVECLAAEHRLDLSRSFVYGDAWSDRCMLAQVGHPVAVNPRARLARLARRFGWPVLRYRAAPEHRLEIRPACLGPHALGEKPR